MRSMGTNVFTSSFSSSSSSSWVFWRAVGRPARFVFPFPFPRHAEGRDETISLECFPPPPFWSGDACGRGESSTPGTTAQTEPSKGACQ